MTATAVATESNVFATVQFSTYEDLSSKLVLLPYNDDACTGAKVKNVQDLLNMSTDVHMNEGLNCAQISVIDVVQCNSYSGDKNVAYFNDPPAAAAASEIETLVDDVNTIDMVIISELNSIQEKCTGINDQWNEKVKQREKILSEETHDQNESYSLVAMRIFDSEKWDDSSSWTSLEGIDFTELLSLLRDATYPLLLKFSHSAYIASDKVQVLNSNINLRPDVKHDLDLGIADHYPDEQNVSCNQSIIVYREDDAKGATAAVTQTAIEIRSRLTRWGLQVATRAVEAASVVQEMKQERQRKAYEVEQFNSIQNTDNNVEPVIIDSLESRKTCENTSSSESIVDSTDSISRLSLTSEESNADTIKLAESTPINETPLTNTRVKSTLNESLEDVKNKCYLFLQVDGAPAYIQLPLLASDCMKVKDEKEECLRVFPLSSSTTPSSSLLSRNLSTPPVTNMSVISVRLSAEKACPVGKNSCHEFQWYRSKFVRTDESLDIFVRDFFSPSEWSILQGACYAAYQPCISDVGHLLCCAVEIGGEDGLRTTQHCILPYPVSTDASLLHSGKLTLLKDGSNSATFSSLTGQEHVIGKIFRLIINVHSNEETNLISRSSLTIEQMGDSSAQVLCDDFEPITAIKARADPSRPRSFELIFPSNFLPSSPALSMLLKSSNSCLKLDAPNRKVRESILVAFGIASFKLSLSSLSTDTVLLPNSWDKGFPVICEDVQRSETDSSTASLRNLYTIQLESQIADMRSSLEAKSSLISKLHQKITLLSEDKKKFDKELLSCRSVTREKTDALAKCEESLEAKEKCIIEQERSMKSLVNEKAVLSAAVEARDGKIGVLIDRIKALEKQLADTIQKAEGDKRVEVDLARAKYEAEKVIKDAQTEAFIREIKSGERHLQEELNKSKLTINDMTTKFAASRDACSRASSELEKMKLENKKLKMDRNVLKHKADGLTKEVSKLSHVITNAAEIRKLMEENQRLRIENGHLQGDIILLRSQKRETLRELEATRLAHLQSLNHNQAIDSDGMRAIKQCADLERVISNMTEYLNAKEMQLSTLKLINEAMTREIEEATQLNQSKSIP